MEYRRRSCQGRNGQLCEFCEKDETTSAPLPTRRPYPDYGKLPTFHYLSWSATPTNGREPDDFQPRAQIKGLFEESESFLVAVSFTRLLGNGRLGSPK